MDPQPRTTTGYVGHGKSQKVGKQKTSHITSQILGIGVAATRVIERQHNDKTKNAHFDNASQRQAMEAQENQSIESNSFDDFFVR